MPHFATLPSTLGELKRAIASGSWPRRSVKDELRSNLLARLRAGDVLFPGVIGYDDTVVPQLVNAILSRHNFILLGLRGQAKTRLLRALTSLLDPEIAVVPGCEIHDDPMAPICGPCQSRVAAEGDAMPIVWRDAGRRYVEKLATPDVTIADLIGDVDPIKAAKSGFELGDARAAVGAERRQRIVVDLAARHHRDRLVQQVGERAQDAALRLAAQAEQDEVVAGQDRVDDLRHDGLVVADDAGEQGFLLPQPGDEVFADFVFDVTPGEAASLDSRTEFGEGRGETGDHRASYIRHCPRGRAEGEACRFSG